MSTAEHEHEEVVAIVAADVSLLRLARALATENLVVRDDADRGVVLIEPAGLLPNLFSEDVRRGVDWYNRLSEAERLHWHKVANSNMPADCWDAFKCGMTLPTTEDGGGTADEAAADAELGMAWYNGLTKAERLHWHRVAASAVPADCWRAFQSGATLPD